MQKVPRCHPRTAALSPSIARRPKQRVSRHSKEEKRGVMQYICRDAKQLASEFVAEGATANKAFHARSILSQVALAYHGVVDLFPCFRLQ